jgi:hypothetical protein
MISGAILNKGQRPLIIIDSGVKIDQARFTRPSTPTYPELA